MLNLECCMKQVSRSDCMKIVTIDEIMFMNNVKQLITARASQNTID